MNNFPKGSDLLVRWAIVRSDGKPFPLTDYSLEISYSAGRVKDFVLSTEIISVEDNAVCWTIHGSRLSFVGPYSVKMKLFKDGESNATLSINNAFNVVAQNIHKGVTVNLMSMI